MTNEIKEKKIQLVTTNKIKEEKITKKTQPDNPTRSNLTQRCLDS